MPCLALRVPKVWGLGFTQLLEQTQSPAASPGLTRRTPVGIAAGAGAVRCGGCRAVPGAGCPPPAPLHPAETLWLHIRSLGQWTNKLYEYFQQPEPPSPEPKPLSRSLREKRRRCWAQVGADGAQLPANHRG